MSESPHRIPNHNFWTSQLISPKLGMSIHNNDSLNCYFFHKVIVLLCFEKFILRHGTLYTDDPVKDDIVGEMSTVHRRGEKRLDLGVTQSQRNYYSPGIMMGRVKRKGRGTRYFRLSHFPSHFHSTSSQSDTSGSEQRNTTEQRSHITHLTTKENPSLPDFSQTTPSPTSFLKNIKIKLAIRVLGEEGKKGLWKCSSYSIFGQWSRTDCVQNSTKVGHENETWNSRA